MRKRLGREGAQVDLYYRFKPAEPPNEKVILWKKGMTLKGRFMGQSVRGEFTDYVFEGEDGKVFSVNRTSAIAAALDGVELGSLIELAYDGKKKLPGGKSYHVIDVYMLTADEGSEDSPL